MDGSCTVLEANEYIRTFSYSLITKATTSGNLRENEIAELEKLINIVDSQQLELNNSNHEEQDLDTKNSALSSLMHFLTLLVTKTSDLGKDFQGNAQNLNDFIETACLDSDIIAYALSLLSIDKLNPIVAAFHTEGGRARSGERRRGQKNQKRSKHPKK